MDGDRIPVRWRRSSRPRPFASTDTGAAGATGVAGAIGATGATGPTGASGAGGGATLLSSNSDGAASPSTSSGGQSQNVAVIPISGVGDTTLAYGNTLDLATSPTSGQPISRDGVITSIAGFASTTQGLSLIGTSVALRVEVWQSTAPNDVYTPIPGASATLAPTLTGIAATGTTLNGLTTGLSIPVVAGSNLIVVYRAEIVAGLSTATTVASKVGVSVGIS